MPDNLPREVTHDLKWTLSWYINENKWLLIHFQESFVFSLVLPVSNRLSIGPPNKKEIPILQKQRMTLASTSTFLKCDDGKSSMKWSFLDGTFNIGSLKQMTL